jgi:hypothetical protein
MSHFKAVRAKLESRGLLVKQRHGGAPVVLRRNVAQGA